MTHPWIHRFALLGLMLPGLLASLSALADNVEILRVTDLESLGEQAREQDLPILIMFSQQECPYCTIMEESYLKPMLRSGEYTHKVIIRKIKIDELDTLTDFDGSRIEVDQLTSRYRAWVTPTLIFVNSSGEEVAGKLVGIGTEGFFAGDIDNAIDRALSKLRAVASR